MLKKIKGIFKDTLAEFLYIKFERVEGSFENSFGVRSSSIFTTFRVIPIMNH